MSSNLQQALSDYKSGRMIIVTDDESRENEADLIFSGESANQENLAFMIRYSSGIVCVAITAERARKLQLPQMVIDNQDSKKTAFTVSVDYKVGLTTGISAAERSNTIRALSSDETKSSEFVRPGHVFPLVASNDLLKTRLGHTEAALAVAQLTNQKPVSVIAELVNDDGTMMRGDSLKVFAQRHNLPIISIKELSEQSFDISSHAENTETQYEWSDLPRSSGSWRITTDSGTAGSTHAVLAFGDISTSPLLVRVHSECLTGDIFGSARCDCGEQLNFALEQIEQVGAGLIVYMRGHEGRGIGLAEKVRAYKLQDAGMNTVEANLALGHSVDLRNWDDAVSILQNLRITSIKLLTNNPIKVQALQSDQLIVEQVPIIVQQNSHNVKYLNTKKHLLNHKMGDL